MLDISTIMRKYGFNESEIKVYLTLINHEQMTGYEVSKLSGVARSKVYNVLENLIQKNMVLVVIYISFWKNRTWNMSSGQENVKKPMFSLIGKIGYYI